MAELAEIGQDISVCDESFNPGKSDHYTLNIHFVPGEFQCTVLERSDNRFLSLATGGAATTSMDAAITAFNSLKKKTPWLSADYRRQVVTWLNKDFTIVPAGLFDAGRKEEYLRLSCGEKSLSGNPQHRKLRSMDAVMVWPEPSEISAFAPKSAALLHAAYVTVDSVLDLNKNQQGKKVYALAHQHMLEVIVIDGHQLLLYNVYDYHTSDDLVYYIMCTFEGLKLNPENIPLLLSGVEKNSAAWMLLYKYIRHVDALQMSEHLSFSYKLSELNPGRFFGLFSQAQCAS